MAPLSAVLFGALLFTAYLGSSTANSRGNKKMDKHLRTESVTSCEESPLHIAVRDGDIAAANKLLDEGTYIYALDCEGRTPMHLAVARETDEMVLVLVRKRFDVNRRFAKGNAVLFHAAVHGREQPLRKLVDVGAIVDLVNSEGSTPLYEAAVGHRIDMARVMVSLGADPKRKLPGGNTYLHRAAGEGSFDAAYYFAGLGDSVDVANDAGETPLMMSVLKDNPALVNLLLARGADITRTTGQGETYAHLAARNNCSEALQAILEYRAGVDSINRQNETPLAIGVKINSRSVINILYNFKADLWRMSGGQTYLHLAVQNQSLDALRALLENGLPADLKNSKGETPIQLALDRDDVASAEVLADFGADLNQRWGADQINLLHWATWRGSTASMRWLVQKGLSVDSTDVNRSTSLHYAAWRGQLDPAKVLVELKCCINCRTNFGATALRRALDNSQEAMAAYLRSVGGTVR